MPEPRAEAEQFIWIPCEVKPGPFSNERVVLVESLDGPWMGFVDVSELQPPIQSGHTAIRARVIRTIPEEGKIELSLPGHSVATTRVIQRSEPLALQA